MPDYHFVFRNKIYPPCFAGFAAEGVTNVRHVDPLIAPHLLFVLTSVHTHWQTLALVLTL